MSRRPRTERRGPAAGVCAASFGLTLLLACSETATRADAGRAGAGPAPAPPPDYVGIELPRAIRAGEADLAPVVAVELATDGSVRVNGLAIALPGLGHVLRAAAGADPDARALISAEPTCLFRDVARLIDELRLAGFRRIGFATDGLRPPPVPEPPASAPPEPDRLESR